MTRLFSLLVASILLSVPAFSQTGSSWERSRVLKNALNPNISVIPDFVWKSGPGSSPGADLREIELGLQSDVDAYGRADIFIAFPTDENEKVEIEEAYFTLTNLPWRLQARGGRFFANYERLNIVHSHEFDFVEKPLVLDRFLGEEGLRSGGVEANWIGGVGPLFVEQSVSFINDLGGTEEGETAKVNTTGGNTVSVKVDEDENARKRARDYASVARTRLYSDLSDELNVELGISGALHQPRLAEHRRLGAADLTMRWRPEKDSLYRSFLWRSAFHYSHRELRDEFDIGTGALSNSGLDTDRRGFYSYASYQPLQRWRVGTLFDYSEDPTDRAYRSPIRQISPAVTFYATEFQRFRTQYQFRRLASGAAEHRGLFQWTLILGPHGAHAY